MVAAGLLVKALVVESGSAEVGILVLAVGVGNSAVALVLAEPGSPVMCRCGSRLMGCSFRLAWDLGAGFVA